MRINFCSLLRLFVRGNSCILLNLFVLRELREWWDIWWFYLDFKSFLKFFVFFCKFLFFLCNVWFWRMWIYFLREWFSFKDREGVVIFWMFFWKWNFEMFFIVLIMILNLFGLMNLESWVLGWNLVLWSCIISWVSFFIFWEIRLFCFFLCFLRSIILIFLMSLLFLVIIEILLFFIVVSNLFSIL